MLNASLAVALMLSGATSSAARLPGIPLSFDVDDTGAWVLPQTLPASFAQAGVQPGWVLSAVDGLALGDAPQDGQRVVAHGPARLVRLHFQTDQGETIVQVPRAPLVVVEELGLLPWPDGFATPAATWEASRSGTPWLRDHAGKHWAFDADTGALTPASGEQAGALEIPALWWSLSDAEWVELDSTGLRRGQRVRADLAGATRTRGFQGQAGDHLAVPSTGGLRVFSVSWPQGTPVLPVCAADVPETCLVAGRQIVATLMDRPGARDEALRDLGVACEGGTTRACLEAVALDDPALADRAMDCVDRDANACHEVARARLAAGAEVPGDVLVGVLEYACDVDASGSLGERLRRLEDVGEGCMLLAHSLDQRGEPDRALLSLDQACVLGRADACDQATQRRADAFALKTVRECEDLDLPLPTSCTQLALLLQDGPIAATDLDAFSAFQRGCQLGDERACVLLGDYVDRWGIGHPRVVRAEGALLESCEQGQARACVGAAHLLVRHDPRTEEYAHALTLFAAACEGGLSTACIAGARQRRIGSARKTDAPAPEALWAQACQQGSPTGCDGLGERQARSKRTWGAAFTAWTQACDTGEAHACTQLGRFVTERHDPPWPGEQPPADYLRRGCDNGDAEGCFRLAQADLPRKGDPPEATYLLISRSCEGDWGDACAALARVHLQRDTSFDDELAAGHLQRACDDGHFESCKHLGDMYKRGKGVERDRTKARELAQRYSVNAQRHHVRLGARLGFPSLAGGDLELVLPIPVGPALAVTGSYSWVPGAGGVMVQLKGGTNPADPPDYRYVDAGVRLYPNNKARGLYGMLGVHQIQATGGELGGDTLTRSGLSARLGMHSDNQRFFTRVEMGLGQYGVILLHDFDDDETGSFPLIQATFAFSAGLSFL